MCVGRPLKTHGSKALSRGRSTAVMANRFVQTGIGILSASHTAYDY
jgi:hypothetical protein